jgi:hypothetical protein
VRALKSWFQRVVLARVWVCFIVMRLAFFGFGVGSLNLFYLLRANGNLLIEHGWMALMDGGAHYQGIGGQQVGARCLIRRAQGDGAAFGPHAIRQALGHARGVPLPAIHHDEHARCALRHLAHVVSPGPRQRKAPGTKQCAGERVPGATPSRLRGAPHSHSIVPGGLLVMS